MSARETEVNPNPARARIPQLDLLRAVAALSVVWVHYWRYPRDNLAAAWPAFSALLTEGDRWLQAVWPRGWSHPGVVLFIVLSGFCIHLPNAGGTGPIGLRTFFRRRFFRIYPVFVAGFALGLLSNALTPPPGNLWVQPTSLWAHAILPSLTAASAVWPGEPPPGNTILNTVISEIGLYLLYPLLWPVVQRRGWVLVLGLTAVVSLGATAFTHYAKVEWAFTSTWGFLFFWWLGAFAAEQRAKGRVLASGRFWVNGAALGALYLIFNTWVRFPAMSLLTGPRMAEMFGPRFEGAGLLTGPFFAVLCAGLICNIDRWRLRAPALEWIGERSYSLYAVHMPVMSLTLGLMLRTGVWPFWLWMTAPLGAVAAAALVCHGLIEAPAMKPGRKS
jgi:peptidoglycan/LPS O-acetylase OafA/YrhL